MGEREWQLIGTEMPDDLVIAGSYNSRGQWVCQIWHPVSLRQELEKQAAGYYADSPHLAFPLTHWMPMPAPPALRSREAKDG